MEYFEEKDIRTVENPTMLWRRYVDDTYVVQHKEKFLRHIHSLDLSIKFTVEDT